MLYNHFADKNAIIDAVAVEGFAELASALRSAAAGDVGAVAQAYLDFAENQPALYDAMFTLASDLPVRHAGGPDPASRRVRGAAHGLHRREADQRDPEVLTEVAWSALHGLAMLTRAGRLRPACATSGYISSFNCCAPGGPDQTWAAGGVAPSAPVHDVAHLTWRRASTTLIEVVEWPQATIVRRDLRRPCAPTDLSLRSIPFVSGKVRTTRPDSRPRMMPYQTNVLVMCRLAKYV